MKGITDYTFDQLDGINNIEILRDIAKHYFKFDISRAPTKYCSHHKHIKTPLEPELGYWCNEEQGHYFGDGDEDLLDKPTKW